MNEPYDHFSGAPCANCESEPQADGSLFCGLDCQDEYEGVGDYAEDRIEQEV